MSLLILEHNVQLKEEKEKEKRIYLVIAIMDKMKDEKIIQ
jgi:hypothetical protein